MKSLAGVLITALLVAGMSIPAQPELSGEQRGILQLGLNLVLLVNEAEQAAFKKSGHFTSFSDLASSGVLTEAADGTYAPILRKLDTKNETEPLSGFRLGIVVSGDGTAYQVLVEQKVKCGGVFFSDNQKAIYFGQPLGCPAN